MTLKCAAHLDTFLQNLSVSDRIAKFADLGFKGFEFWCWWDKKYDIDAIASVTQKKNIEVVATCTKFVSLVDLQSRSEYIAGLKESIAACKKLNCKILISQVGNELKDKSRGDQIKSMVEGLKTAAGVLEGTGITLAVEPLNLLVDHAGYFLSRSDEAAQVLEAVNSKSVMMLYDIYHQQITEGNIISNIVKYKDIIGHFHCGGVPGRHELVGGELDYQAIFKAIRTKTNYNGYVGLEFFPVAGDEQALVQSMSLFK